jgi:7-carboxy-7-deazaguanine synthase
LDEVNLRSEIPKSQIGLLGYSEIVRITEIFFSVQGESTHVGKPCVFVRLTGCSLRCVWCDTKYSYFGGKDITLDGVFEEIKKYPAKLVEVTGGEPLEQDQVYPFMERLLKENYTVMLETGGHVKIDKVPPEVIKIIDIKCPDSGEADKNDWSNLDLAARHDEFKFVIASRRDYEWARNVVRERFRSKPNATLFSPSHEDLPAVDLAGWILEDGLPVRLQLQIHKYIWGANVRGV